MIFDESTLRKISRLTLVAQRVRVGALRGERRSPRRGSGQEFADYRGYTPGDDLRRVDWNAYARLDRPFLKLFEAEEDLAVHVLVDASGSMDWGEGVENKFQYALRLAGALAVIALANGDRVQVSMLGEAEIPRRFGPARGQQQTVRLLQFLERQRPGGQTHFDRLLSDYAAANPAGIAILISDLLAPGGYQAGLNQLLGRGYEVLLIHLLAPEEIDPPLAGDLRLVDVETGQPQEVSLDAGLRDLYRRRIRDWRAEILAHCRRRSLRCLSVDSSTPWEQVILREFRAAHIVK